MFSRTAARRIAAALTAALVAVLLVTLGGPARLPGDHTATAEASHAAANKSARIPQAVVSAQHHQSPLQLDLATTPPSAAPGVRATVADTAAEPVAVRTGRALVSPTGRAPPAL